MFSIRFLERTPLHANARERKATLADSLPTSWLRFFSICVVWFGFFLFDLQFSFFGGHVHHHMFLRVGSHPHSLLRGCGWLQPGRKLLLVITLLRLQVLSVLFVLDMFVHLIFSIFLAGLTSVKVVCGTVMSHRWRCRLHERQVRGWSFPRTAFVGLWTAGLSYHNGP